MKYDYIKNGDCLELMKEIPDGSIDMILCDLPYGTTACKWDEIIPFDKLWEQYKRIIKKGGAIVLFGSEPFSSKLRMSNLKMYKYDWIWEKPKGSGFLLSKKMPMKNHENISVFYETFSDLKETTNICENINKYNPQFDNGEPYIAKQGCSSDIYNNKENNIITQNTGIRFPKSVLKYSIVTGLHPTQKPVALLEYLIRTYTNENDVVLDNCMGSGSTCVAAKNVNRHFIGFELDKNYFYIAQQRIAGNIVIENPNKIDENERNLFNIE